MGELHLDVLVDRMMREFTVAANVGKPQVAYRETITVPVEKIEERYVRQTGGRGQYGHVVITLEPTGPGGGYEFVDKITGGVIPREYIPAVDAGIQEAMEGGVLAGLPARRHPGHPHLRLVPRRRLERDGVQDRRLDGVQEGGAAGQAGAARADHGGRGRHARGLHGRRDRRPVVAPGQGRGDGAARQRRTWSVPKCRSARCSATLPTFARAPRVARPTRCSSTRTSRCPSRSPKRSSPGSAASSAPERRQEQGTVPWRRRSSSGRSRT